MRPKSNQFPFITPINCYNADFVTKQTNNIAVE